MRLVAALVIVLSACGAKATTGGPAWPKAADKETDGGESLAPRAKAASVAAVEAADEAESDATPEADKPAAPGEAKPETPKPATPGATQAPEEITITTEDIVIEIDD